MAAQPATIGELKPSSTGMGPGPSPATFRPGSFRGCFGSRRALTADYEHKERAFLREQAGILAASLHEGRPCPVCGSTNHAQPAVPGSEAPSESELRLAKRQASAARDYAYNASREASDWNGRVQTKQDDL